ncbi:hypothetical protein [Oceanobacillus salinisoli]|uniref:hypothetical protein n=1 Tax=Oceanobacillus salinisoli TaxID=2678611 RepID=UPI0012E1A7F8|nr:hypothetical protein [Oceanobacillus salinisoli]
MTELKYKKIISVLAIVILIIFSFINVRQYMSYNKALDKKGEAIQVNVKNDFETFKNKDEGTLERFGFSNEEIKAIQEIELNSLTLSDFIILFETNDNHSVNKDDLALSEITSISEKTEGETVEVTVNPDKTLFIDENEGNGRTFYTNLHYTVDIKKLMFFQSEDQFKLNYNNWYPFFGYAKLHYVSTDGKVHEEFVSKEEKSHGNEPFKFKVRKKVNNETYYLSSISGIYIMKSQGDLSLYAEYTHNQLIRNTSLGKHWSDWAWTLK